jgi:hypothetical protein
MDSRLGVEGMGDSNMIWFCPSGFITGKAFPYAITSRSRSRAEGCTCGGRFDAIMFAAWFVVQGNPKGSAGELEVVGLIKGSKHASSVS